ncbi:MAG: hypothetical protein MUE40_07505 [Anaerolineae bacterium]|nr:hypothetical protein [Anaerolineae bacterium]
MTSAAFHIHPLKPHLILIRWQRTPSLEEEHQFVDELKHVLETATQPLYFLSDLREGRLTRPVVLNRLGQLTTHPHWAGSTAFGGGFRSAIYVGMFEKLAARKKDIKEIWDTAEDALAYLESIAPGITGDIDWPAALA